MEMAILGDSQPAYQYATLKTWEKALVLVAKTERIAPGLGVVGNVVSLAVNLKPEIKAEYR